jgi:TRAP-type uncharacterized transport system fused permease subunit
VLAALGAPALVTLGAPLLAAHLFIFYFGCLSNITPPVALAGYAAAGLADAPPLKTGFTAAVLAASGFVVPFLFVYRPSLLLLGPPLALAGSLAPAIVAVVGLSAALIGYARRPLAVWERALMAGGAVSLIFPGVVSVVAGLVLVGFGFRRGPAAAAPARESPEVVA